MKHKELEALEKIHEDVVNQIIEKYGIEKYTFVNDLDPSVTTRMLMGVKIEGLEQWVYDLMYDFQRFIMQHPAINFPQPN